MRRLRLNRSARRNLREIAQYLYRQGIDRRSISRTLGQLGEQCQKLAELPGELGRPRPELAPGLRSFPFRAYVVFFRYTDDELEVVNILGRRRDHPVHVAIDDD